MGTEARNSCSQQWWAAAGFCDLICFNNFFFLAIFCEGKKTEDWGVFRKIVQSFKDEWHRK